IGDIEARLYGGVVSAPRELSAMSEEVASLRRRRSELEDQAIAVMEEAEPLDAALADLAEERRRLEAERAQVSAAIAEAEAAIAEEEAAERRAREDQAAHLPADLADQYEALRARLGGVGAARLVHGSCTGCHLTLPASEQERLRHLPPDDVATCDQCGRILAR
ncbi:MAG TPA: C4-type zinc ribbon domain-containing protein, partial [Acidimicrobiales bacterium]|nr:C4-type zinc ribbon domain-containing protein [Acidimicrobiales bacterium]